MEMSVPELICDFIKIRTRNFELRVNRKCQKAIRSSYNDLRYCSDRREVRSIENSLQSTYFEENPAASTKITQVLKDCKSSSQKAHGEENTAYPIRYENIVPIFNEFIGIPTEHPLDNAESLSTYNSGLPV